jgi:5-methylcytosine-specific restriction endonuclease McrA
MNNMKICTKCKIEKSVAEFSKNRTHADGLRYSCKRCDQVRSAKQRANPAYVEREKQRCLNNREKLLVYKKQYYEKHKEKHRALTAARYKNNREATIMRSAAWAKAHPAERLHDCRMRQLTKHRAVLPWLTKGQHQEIREFYRCARELTRQTGIAHEVDHIVPLRGKQWLNGHLIEVRGFHAPWNLQIITAKENNKKLNKFLGVANG